MSAAPLRFVSYGGGVQSTALLVLAVEGRINFRTFVMANVGADSENPATLAYLTEHAIPYAEAGGIDLHVIDKVLRDGTVETLYGRLTREGSRSLPIPVRMDNGAPGTRSCTSDFKIRVTGKWAKAHGATADNPATVALGISADEAHRANTRKVEPYERVVYPLLGIGEDTGLRLNRADCARIISNVGLPVPPKSSCYFCPLHRVDAWETMAREDPASFERAAELEDTLNARRDLLGKDRVYLTRYGKPLRLVATGRQTALDLDHDDDGCDSGWCAT